MIIKSSAVQRLLCWALLLVISSCGDSPFLKDSREDLSTGSSQETSGVVKLESLQLAVKTYWREGPLIGDESRSLIVLLNRDNTPVSTDYEVRLKLWMPTMGHGSFPVSLNEISPGVFEARDIFFTMPGYWDIHFQLFRDNNLIEEVTWGLEL